MNARAAAAEKTARDTRRNVVLIGYRGSGKSSVGQRLAERLEWHFVDTDALVEQDAGRSVRDIFESAGEAAFRRLETQAVERVAAGTQQVISVGGGAVLSEHNGRLLRSAGVCIWLRANADELYRRLEADPRTPALRPALTDRLGLDEIERVLQMRTPLYAALADHVVDTTGRSVAEVVDAVAALLASL